MRSSCLALKLYIQPYKQTHMTESWPKTDQTDHIHTLGIPVEKEANRSRGLKTAACLKSLSAGKMVYTDIAVKIEKVNILKFSSFVMLGAILLYLGIYLNMSKDFMLIFLKFPYLAIKVGKSVKIEKIAIFLLDFLVLSLISPEVLT